MSTFIHEQMKFFFIHVPKTGGRTVTEYFKFSKDKTWRNVYSALNDRMPIHAGVTNIYDRLGAEMDEYFSFAFYRNSWAWNYSWYRYICKTPHHPLHERATPLSFEQWIMTLAPEDVRLQSELVCLDGVQAVGRLLPFERFGQEFPRILDELGYDEVGFKSFNVDPNKKPYRDVYTEAMRDRVAELFADDIAYFDFRF